jgi:small subunit ribosomal protein S9
VQKLDPQGRAYATGKRKDAVARVWIKPRPRQSPGGGKALDAISRAVLGMILQQPLGVAKRNVI